jgi:hypothetical protein
MAEADSRQDTEHGSFFGCVGGVYCLLRYGLSAHSAFFGTSFVMLDQRSHGFGPVTLFGDRLFL